MKTLHLGALVVISMAGMVYAAEKEALASARAKLAALGLGQTALLANPKLAHQKAVFEPQTFVVVGADEEEATLSVPPTAVHVTEKAFMPKKEYAATRLIHHKRLDQELPLDDILSSAAEEYALIKKFTANAKQAHMPKKEDYKRTPIAPLKAQPKVESDFF